MPRSHSGKSAATRGPACGAGLDLAEAGCRDRREIVEQIARTRLSIDPDNPYGNGVCGQGVPNAASPASMPTSSTRPRGSPGNRPRARRGVTACVAVPLIKAGESIGVLMFFVGKLWAADEEIVALMARIAENVSFALDNFDRAGEKAKSRRPEGTSGAHAGGAQRDQRSDHACQRRAPSCSNWCAKLRRRAAGSTRPASRWPDPTATLRYGGRGGSDGRATCAR